MIKPKQKGNPVSGNIKAESGSDVKISAMPGGNLRDTARIPFAVDLEAGAGYENRATDPYNFVQYAFAAYIRGGPIPANSIFISTGDDLYFVPPPTAAGQVLTFDGTNIGWGVP